MQGAQGDTAAALKSYRAGFAIAEKLASRDPRNSLWQRDLAVSYAISGRCRARRAILRRR